MQKLLVCGIAAAAFLSAAGPTIASDRDRTSQRSGSDIGPLGQCFDARACGRAYYRGPYGYGLATGPTVGGTYTAPPPAYGDAGYGYGPGYYAYPGYSAGYSGYAYDYGPGFGGPDVQSPYAQTCTYVGARKPATGRVSSESLSF